MKRIDLHVHTTHSDGTLTPAETVSLASSLGLAAIAITDHDNISGYPEAKQKGDQLGVEVISGIELSTAYKGSVHLLGYCMDPSHPDLCQTVQEIIEERDIRNRKIVSLMQKDHIPVSYEEMQHRFGEAIGRPHFARILMDYSLASSVTDAFRNLLSRGQHYWVPRKTLDLPRCIQLILKAGGIPVLAHPFEYKYEEKSLPELIETCIDAGLQGIECRHSSHTPGQMAYLERLADEYGLVKTGGSDFHGTIKPDIQLGSGKGLVSVPSFWLDELKKRKPS